MFYFVAGPIGNLGDITHRALEIISLCDYILSEDTRETVKILNHYGIKKRLVAFNQYSDYKIQTVLEDLKNGKNIALLSDAGTPGLCDPGGKLAEAIIASSLEFSGLPGPSALTTLISIAPFPCSEFCFLGYFPKKKGRTKMVEYLKNIKTPIFFFESPHRILGTIKLFRENISDHRIFIGRELTKKFEQIIYKKIAELSDGEIIVKGEFVFAIVPCQKS